MTYIGETKQMVHSIVAEHHGYVSNLEIDKATGAHFNMPGYSLADLRVSAIEHTKGRGIKYRKERDHYFIRIFDTFHRGFNKQK